MEKLLPIGQKVRLKSTNEVGIVVWSWKCKVMGIDNYIAFFGDQFPTNTKIEKPYILRYASCSLELIK